MEWNANHHAQVSQAAALIPHHRKNFRRENLKPNKVNLAMIGQQQAIKEPGLHVGFSNLFTSGIGAFE